MTVDIVEVLFKVLMVSVVEISHDSDFDVHALDFAKLNPKIDETVGSIKVFDVLSRDKIRKLDEKLRCLDVFDAGNKLRLEVFFVDSLNVALADLVSFIFAMLGVLLPFIGFTIVLKKNEKILLDIEFNLGFDQAGVIRE